MDAVIIDSQPNPVGHMSPGLLLAMGALKSAVRHTHSGSESAAWVGRPVPVGAGPQPQKDVAGKLPVGSTAS